jgi:3-dehydro-L-gulonate 2-dehydrogenase
MLRIAYDELSAAMRRAIERTGMAPDRAEAARASSPMRRLDGVASHGVNRFARFMGMIRSGHIDVHARPERIATTGRSSDGTAARVRET